MAQRGTGPPANEWKLTSSDQNRSKRLAAIRAVDEVQNHSAIGLGTGTTARYFLEELAQRLKDGVLRSVVGIPTSKQTAELASQLHIPLSSLDKHPILDLAIDGADEIDPHLDLIKGHGGALLREKIVAAAARQFLVIADHSKQVKSLGETCAVPIEVIPFGLALVMQRLRAFPGDAKLRQTSEGQPFHTDDGNWIVDYACGPLSDPRKLDMMLNSIPGIVEHGLFLNMAQRAIVGNSGRATVLDR